MLGMTDKELKTYFDSQCKKIQPDLIRTDGKRIESSFRKNGIPESEAKILTLAHIEAICVGLATIGMIQLNNARIQSQLEGKGFDV